MLAGKSVESRAAAHERRSIWVEAAILLAASSAISATLFLHFLRPHGDFYEFRESGAALLAGRLPETTKRGPVFPLVIATLGRLAATLPGRAVPADQLGTALLNVVLLPAIVLLVYFVTRRWNRAAAPWAGLAALAAPQLWLAGAHVLVEPLLALLMLLTVLLVQRGSRWAYVCAAVASVTRYDLAGLLIGVAVADWLRGTTFRRIGLRVGVASLPLTAWLALTVWTWSTHSRDHYIEQMLEHAQHGALHFDPVWACRSVLGAAGAGAKPGLPNWFADLRPLVEAGLPLVSAALALIGIFIGLRRRDVAVATAAIGIAAYITVHAWFPFRLERFGIPPAPLAIAIAASGGGAVAAWAQRGSRAAVGALVAAAFLFAGAMVLWEVDVLGARWLGLDDRARVRCSAALLAVLGLAGAALARAALRPHNGLAWKKSLALAAIVCGAMGATALTLADGREAQALLGKRQCGSALVDAATWVSHTLPADARVLSGVGGLLALHSGSGTARFPGFEQIAADDWDDILRECAERRIGCVLWYDGFLDEQGEYYVEKWRLGRFARLKDTAAAGLEIEKRFAGEPAVVIYRLRASP